MLPKQLEEALNDCTTISKSKIGNFTKLCMKHQKRYKDVVHHVEKFIRKGKNKSKLPALYIIDSICRSSLSKDEDKSKEKPKTSKYIVRFGRNIEKTFHALCRGPETDRPEIKRIFSLWHKDGWAFPSDQMESILKIGSEFPDNTMRAKEKKTKSKTNEKKKQLKNKKIKKEDEMHSIPNDNNLNITEIVKIGDKQNGENDLLKSLESLSQNDILGKRIVRGTEYIPSMHEFTTNEEPPSKRMKLNPTTFNENNNFNDMQLGNNMIYDINQYNGNMINNINSIHNVNQMDSMNMFLNNSPHINDNIYLNQNHSYDSFPGWEIATDQSTAGENRTKVVSCTLYVGFWNHKQRDTMLKDLEDESIKFGKVIRIMPHPTKPPHKHAFVQYTNRKDAENARIGLRKLMTILDFIQKVGWGRPPKIQEPFNFGTGIGEISNNQLQHYYASTNNNNNNLNSIPINSINPQLNDMNVNNMYNNNNNNNDNNDMVQYAPPPPPGPPPSQPIQQQTPIQQVNINDPNGTINFVNDERRHLLSNY